MVETLHREVVSTHCANCEELLAGDYCHACGEERAGRRDLSLKHFFKRSLQELIDIDQSKVLRTLRALLTQPGHLTNEYFGGRRGRYLSPLKLFLTAFAASVLLYTAYAPVNAYDIGAVLKAQGGGGNAMREYEKLAARKKMDLKTLNEQISERLQRYFDWTKNLAILLLALFMIAIYWRSGRFYVEHLVFTLHLFSFSNILTIIFWPLMMLAGIGNWQVSLLFYGVVYAYLFAALRNVYKETVGATAVKSLVLIVCYFVVAFIAFMGALAFALVNTMRA